MIAFLLLLPVGLLLTLLYWLCLPVEQTRSGRWRWIDSVLLLALVILASIFVYTALHTNVVDAPPIWTEVVAAIGGYIVIIIGLTIGLIIRRYAARKRIKPAVE